MQPKFLLQISWAIMITADELDDLRITRILLFGVGGFDGNASLAVLAEKLDEEFTANQSSRTESNLRSLQKACSSDSERAQSWRN
jgi:hypothetical protein